MTPEQNLAQAVLEEAVVRLNRYARGQTVGAAREYQEVKAWFEDANDDYLYAFPSVCQILGLDPSAVRGRVFQDLASALALHTGHHTRRPKKRIEAEGRV